MNNTYTYAIKGVMYFDSGLNDGFSVEMKCRKKLKDRKLIRRVAKIIKANEFYRMGYGNLIDVAITNCEMVGCEK